MPKLTINNKVVEAEEGTTILEAAKSAGIFIPHFCYHPYLSIAGNCRMCAVEVAGEKKPVISCRETVKEGMRVFTDSPMILEARRSVLEFILINHPMDCPVCDQSGECELQNYYQKYSLKPSVFTEKKVKKPKAVRIGKNVVLDAERCIECARCVRFCDEITKTGELTIMQRSDRSTIGIFPGRELNNAYSLCAVDLCPVGALTSADFRFKKRVWLLKSTPSICDGCATGCNMFVDHHDGIVYRYRPRENHEVNGFCMCDEGRLSYKRINSADRVLFPMILSDHELRRSSWTDALLRVKELAGKVKPEETAGVLSALASVEENEAFARFMREEMNTQNIFWSGRDSDPSFKDNMLRDADKNPNTKGVLKFAGRRINTERQVETEAEVKAYFILDGVTDNELIKIVSSKPRFIVLITSSHDAGRRYADVILPKASFVEQPGTFINKKGISQRFEKAFEPRGESLPGAEVISRLTDILK
jgi:NADH-quinone oxidoreductase subunit G